MSKFADLLAMSKAQTAAKDAAVQSAISQREAKQREEAKEAEHKHKIELERQAKMRQAQAEAAVREAERAKQRELAAKAKAEHLERMQQVKVQEMLNKTRHQAFEKREKEAGAPGYRRKKDKGSDDDMDVDGGPALTRAEKRALKMDPDSRPAWAQKLVGGSRSNSNEPRSTPTSQSRSPAKSKRPAKSAGNFTHYLSAPSSLAAQGDQSLPIRERLKQSDYFVPIKLSAVRRDTRTQADYFQEKRQRALAANGGRGDDPYADWNSKSDGASGTDTKMKSSKPARIPLAAGPSTSATGKLKGAAASTPSLHDASPSIYARKRQRSESFSSSDLDSDGPPHKRPKQPSAGRSSMRDEIWKLVSGKSRSHYQDDVFSDEDDDMEVSAREVAREEAKSLKVARLEDQLAEEEERRRETEKRKRKLRQAA